MSITVYYIICAVLALLVLLGISMMSKVKTSVQGNLLSAVSLFAGIIITLIHYGIYSISTIYIFIAIGLLIGYVLAVKVKMIQMPQMVAVFNGVGGAASALVGMLALVNIGVTANDYPTFSNVTAALALVVGLITLIGSLVAAGKLHKILAQKPVVWKNHNLINFLAIAISFLAIILAAFIGKADGLLFNPVFILIIGIIFSSLFGLSFAIRVGGADMPITISLLNSLSGVAGSIAGMAIGDILLVAVGGIVGASGLLLTQIMCRAMNRRLDEILLGKTSVAAAPKKAVAKDEKVQPKAEKPKETKSSVNELLNSAKNVLIVPGYGMALAQAQHQVKMLADKLEANGAEVRYAIHPVAGRMPGHMNVLLAEADITYDKLFEMKNINNDFKDADLVIVIGANDVLNPAAKNAVGTPIYGMPILNVDDCKNVIICNYDKQPGYAGVDNPLYEKEGVNLILGDAKETIGKLINEIGSSDKGSEKSESKGNVNNLLNSAKNVLIVPGYGMALAQAQHQVKMLADKLEANGAEVRYAIHPVAGRMPGHMNVLLAEADITYDKLFEMKNINNDFKDADLVIVIGANDVLNPAAKNAVGTPIYGMPILNVDDCKNVIICNYDKQPGYAGVDNPLYEKEGVNLILGDAKETIGKLINEIGSSDKGSEKSDSKSNVNNLLNSAKNVLIVPGYGMALAQAQHQVKMLADKLEANGAEVRYAIHPVAGRMPGHMNVLLAEADITYDKLFEMKNINNDFKDADLVIVIGANDVLNPAAKNAVGTPIYGMPILNVDDCKNVIICNYDKQPGYAGVDNPLYEKEGVNLILGDAKETLQELINMI